MVNPTLYSTSTATGLTQNDALTGSASFTLAAGSSTTTGATNAWTSVTGDSN